MYYKNIFPNIIYVYSNEKKGIDIDMSATVDFARGEYCWLMSSDDAISFDAIKILRDAISSKAEVILCNRTVCDIHLRPIKEKTWLRDGIGSRIFELWENQNLYAYLNSAVEFGSIFSYMSVLIFKRDEWIKVGYSNDFTGTGYAHVYRIFGMFNNRCRLKYIRDPLVKNRSFNDSFMEMGVIKRFMLDINGYLKLADKLFGSNEEIASLFLRVMILEHPWHQLIKLRAQIKTKAEWVDIEKSLLQCGYSPIGLKLYGFLGKFKPIIKYLVKVRYLYNTSMIHRYLYHLKCLAIRVLKS
jgi:abequosyltransferase